MSAKERTDKSERTPRRQATAARLKNALATLSQASGGGEPFKRATVTELCRLAEVSRNAVYRYHAPILQALRKQKSRRRTPTQSRAMKSDRRRRIENVALHEQIAKLAGLVDHHYAAYREAAGLLERRDRELAELRRRLKSTPVLVNSR